MCAPGSLYIAHRPRGDHPTPPPSGDGGCRPSPTWSPRFRCIACGTAGRIRMAERGWRAFDRRSSRLAAQTIVRLRFCVCSPPTPSLHCKALATTVCKGHVTWNAWRSWWTHKVCRQQRTGAGSLAQQRRHCTRCLWQGACQESGTALVSSQLASEVATGGAKCLLQR